MAENNMADTTSDSEATQPLDDDEKQDCVEPINADPTKKFRFQGIKVLLTYPQSKIRSKEELVAKLQKIIKIAKYCVGAEKHADGGNHYHVYLHFGKSLDTRNARYFDVDGEHPNWRKVKDVMGAVEYCMKDGKFTADGINLFLNSKGYKRRKDDHDAWCRDMRAKQLTDVTWPIQLPAGLGIASGAGSKRRHFWIVGPPDSGKTTWVQTTFKRMKVFPRRSTNYPFENYNGEQVIIYDDIIPSFEEIANVSTDYGIPTHVFGATRYKETMWPIDQERVMFVLCNVTPDYGSLQAAFLSRFNVVVMK